MDLLVNVLAPLWNWNLILKTFLRIRNVYCGNTSASIYNNHYKCVSIYVELWEWKKNTVCIKNRNFFSSQSKSSAVSESDVRSWYVAKTHRTEQHPEISGPSKAAEALGEDMRQLGHVQSLTHVSVMIPFFFFFNMESPSVCPRGPCHAEPYRRYSR